MEQKFLGIFAKKKKKDSDDYEHKIIVSDYLPIVEGTLNGKKCYFLLDTGASISVLDTTQIAKYGVKTVSKDDMTIGGYGGVSSDIMTLSNVNVFLSNEKLNKEFLGKDISYLIKPIRNNTGYTVVGIIGNNNISSEKFIIDFKNKVIRK